MKQRLNVNIDADVYLLAKQSEVNLSDLINKLLRQYFQTREEQHDEAELLESIDKRRRKIQQEQEELSKDTILLVQLREQKERFKKDEEQRREVLWKTVRNSGMMEELE